eukprot:1669380-Pyramimonas_sp.AAC.1
MRQSYRVWDNTKTRRRLPPAACKSEPSDTWDTARCQDWTYGTICVTRSVLRGWLYLCFVAVLYSFAWLSVMRSLPIDLL